ncbi:MAG TPA: amylo-alpha-1,6-glucosidase [Candidatus Eisenbacteria bacterium]|nr:amylo-alpha-1,6-glucosidase [Candidatus Eisenbacteria bacterium]
MSQKELVLLREKIYRCLRDLETPEGINASGKDEVFGCIFGRDSFITILKILKANKTKHDHDLLQMCKKSLLTHCSLQGTQENIESGEQPGKFIHEYRVDKYERLVNRPLPWYIYPDKILRNYDSIDATPLGLIALYKYWETTKDSEFLKSVLPSVKHALQWIIRYGDMDDDYLIEYELPRSRKFGGLVVQSWADSLPSLADKEGNLPSYPIAPVEVQAISYVALMLWSDYFLEHEKKSKGGKVLSRFATQLKKTFEEKFLLKSNGLWYLAQALNGEKNPVPTITSNPLLCMWASYEKNGKRYSIIDEVYITDMVKRAFQPDLFVPHAGIRTMSALSPTFNPNENSYHNGSFWPMLNGLIVEGLDNFGFTQEASLLTHAMLQPIHHFDSPIELYIEKEGDYLPYKSMYGQSSCMNQAWSAAAIYDVLLGLTAPAAF